MMYAFRETGISEMHYSRRCSDPNQDFFGGLPRDVLSYAILELGGTLLYPILQRQHNQLIGRTSHPDNEKHLPSVPFQIESLQGS